MTIMTTMGQSSKAEALSLSHINKRAVGQLIQVLPFYLIATGAILALITMPFVTWAPQLLNTIHPSALNIATTVGSIGGATDAVGVVLLALQSRSAPQ